MTYLESGRYRVSALSARVLLEPDYEAALDDQALIGEDVEVLEMHEEFARVHVIFSGKEGWIPAAAQKLIPIEHASEPTHRVRLPRAITFRKPDAEAETMVILPMNAQLALGEQVSSGKDEFARVLGLSVEAWVRTSALSPLGEFESDFVAVQEFFVGKPYGAPYVWGARDSTLGFDCSGLLIESLRACGHSYCPRDTKDQINSFIMGTEIPFPPRGLTFHRGDLIFWKGHVATMVNRTHCIHATDLVPHHQVLVQELGAVISERLIAGKGNILKVRRFEEHQPEHLNGLVA